MVEVGGNSLGHFLLPLFSIIVEFGVTVGHSLKIALLAPKAVHFKALTVCKYPTMVCVLLSYNIVI